MIKNNQIVEKTGWTLLSNHGHVLICLVRDPEMRLRDVALQVGITERAVQKIVSELEASGILSKEKVGRCNQYTFDEGAPMRHPLESQTNVGALISALK
ncbi:MAG: winged helix-turn-helix domain-containing protein [Opitutales bacterium]|nr:winged helix-turn-helix domain-containing protein [Opitutales bacterium]